MTKKNDETVKTSEEETKTNLKWRLPNKISLEDVTTMLDKGIIDKDEAKSMLFSEEKPLTRDETIKALQEQVEFQKTVIEKLMDKPAPVVWGYINTYTPTYRWNGLTYSQPTVLVGKLNTGLMNSISGTTLTTAGTGTGNSTAAYYSVGKAGTTTGSISGGGVIDA